MSKGELLCVCVSSWVHKRYMGEKAVAIVYVCACVFFYVCNQSFLCQSGHSSRVSCTTWTSVSPGACHWVLSQLECAFLIVHTMFVCLCASAEEGPPMMSLQCQQQTPLSYPSLILWALGGPYTHTPTKCTSGSHLRLALHAASEFFSLEKHYQ